MASLLETYENMLKEAEAQEEVNARVEFLSKYAEEAESLLQESFPNNFTKSDVIELANGLIARDAEQAEMQEKVAELEEIGREMAHDTVKGLAIAFEKEAGAFWDKIKGLKMSSEEMEHIKSTLTGLSTKQKVYGGLAAAGVLGTGAVAGRLSKKGQ